MHKIILGYFFASLLLLTSVSEATSFESETMTCPVCDQDYNSLVLISWNSLMSYGSAPPQSTGLCPYCLHKWKGEPEKLSPSEQIKQLELTRQKIINQKEELPQPKKIKTKGLRATKKQATNYLKLLHQNPVSLNQVQTHLKESIFIGSFSDWIAEENPEITAVFLTYLLYAPDHELQDSSYSFAKITDQLRDISEKRWPDLPAATNLTKIKQESLKYLRGHRAWGKDFDRSLLDTKLPGEANWLIACAASRKDQSPSKTLKKILLKKDYWQHYEVLAHYYDQCGKLSDLADLERSHRHWISVSNRHKTWDTSEVMLDTTQNAMIKLRTKLIKHDPSNASKVIRRSR